ncbi:MAG: hypothetical protein WAV52_14700 [Luteococcus japonicus]
MVFPLRNHCTLSRVPGVQEPGLASRARPTWVAAKRSMEPSWEMIIELPLGTKTLTITCWPAAVTL